MTLRKKVLIISIITLIVTPLAYTGLWFLSKKVAEENISKALYSLKEQQSLKYITFNLNSSCFPKLCTTVSNIKTKTQEGFNGNAKGFEISAFAEKPLVFNRNNLLSPSLTFKQKHIAYDLHITDLITNKTVDTSISADLINLNISKDKSTLNIKNAAIESMSEDSPFITILNLKYLTAELANSKKETSKNTTNYTLTYNLGNFNAYNPQNNNVTKSIKHSAGNISIKNIPDSIFANINKITNNKRQFIVDSLQTMADNNAKIIINDFKATTNHGQYIIKGNTLINPNYYLELNANLNLKFRNLNPVEEMLKAYKINKHNNRSYILTVRTENNIISINNKIKIPAAYFKPGIIFKQK